MSGLGLILSIAKDALAAQTYGIDVTGHNIANVSTESYSRQRPIHEAREPAPYGGVIMGRGVDTTRIERICDQFIESQLTQRPHAFGRHIVSLRVEFHHTFFGHHFGQLQQNMKRFFSPIS